MDPNWLSAMVATATLSGAAATYIERKRTERRAAMPSIMRDGANIAIINRLDEIIEVTRIEANGPFALSEGSIDDQGVFQPGVRDWIEGPLSFSLRIRPKSEERTFVRVAPGTRMPTVVLTFDSSAGTLRSKRIRVPMFIALDVPDHRPFPLRIWSKLVRSIRGRPDRIR